MSTPKTTPAHAWNECCLDCYEAAHIRGAASYEPLLEKGGQVSSASEIPKNPAPAAPRIHKG